MNLATNPYYKEMLHKERLIPFFTKDNRLVCFITFFIGSSEDENKYIRDNMWDVLEDNPKGDVCFIDQLWTDKVYENKKLSYGIWRRFKDYIQHNFSSVKLIRWNRAKINRLTGIREVKTYKKEMKKSNFDICKNECKAYCCNIITLLLKNNRTPEEENDMQLILAHNGTHFHKQDGVQYIEIESKCKFLTEDNECSIYEQRFNLCRRYECEKIKKEMEKCLN